MVIPSPGGEEHVGGISDASAGDVAAVVPDSHPEHDLIVTPVFTRHETHAAD